jgi:conjugal transfer pilus assembly protein TraE
MQKENTWGRIIIVLALLIIGALVVQLSNQKAVITMIPPSLSEEAKLHHDKAQKEIHKAWSLYVAESLGNVTPATAQFVRSTLDPLLDSRIRSEALVILDRQIDRIKRDQVSFSFEPREVQMSKDTDIVYVVGRHYTHAAVGDATRVNRTFELKWEFEKYMPKLVQIDTYEGAPRL